MTVSYERFIALADRDAVGDSLSSEEQAFLREFASSDPAALAELELFESLASEGAHRDAAADRAIAEAAVRALARPTVIRSRTVKWLLWGAASAAAAAAAVAVFSRTPAPVAQGPSVIEYVAAKVSIDGRPAEMGTHIAVGSEVVAIGGPACVAVESRIHACLAEGSKLQLSQVGPGKRRLDLTAGRVAVALDPLPPNERLSVVAAGVWSTAVGTAFSVELLSNGSVQTIVHEGKVAVGSEQGTDVVSGHKIGLSTGGSVRIEPPIAHGQLETPDWVALGKVATRSIEGPIAEIAAETSAPVTAESPVAAPVAHKRASPVVAAAPAAREPVAEEPAAPAVTPDSLLAEARQALRDQRWSDAASAYRRLVGAFPASSEAHAVLVPLARLELDRFGSADAALRDLNAYLTRGGPLSSEAKLAKVRAYRALGRTSEEAATIDDILAGNPNTLEAEQLRQRRDALRKQ